MTDKITIRPMRDSDMNFILATWLRTYKYSGELAKRVRDGEYFNTYEPMVKAMLPGKTTIACLTDDPDVIVGYLCCEATRSVMHFIFIKESWRNMGIAKYLMIKSGLTENSRFTHWTKPVDTLINKYPTFIYNPWLLR